MESIMMDVPAFEGDSGSWDDVSATLVARPATAPKESSKKPIQVKAIKESVNSLGTKVKKRALESGVGNEEPSGPAKKQKKTTLSTQSAARVAVPEETERGGNEAKVSGKNLGKRRRANEKRMRIREERKAAAIAKQKEVKGGPIDGAGRTETSKVEKTTVKAQRQSKDAAQSKTAQKSKKNNLLCEEASQGNEARENLPKESPKKRQVLPAKKPATAVKGSAQKDKAPGNTASGSEQPTQVAPEPRVAAGKLKKTPKKQSGKVEEASPVPSVPESASRKKQGKSSILDRLKSHLSGGHFRFLNEALYTQIGESSFEQFQAAPILFDQYHDGFREQTKKWPTLPVHVCRDWLKNKPAEWVVADFGCGDAQLAKEVRQKVHSLDLVATTPDVIACNMADTPLETASADVAVFCLALMGTDYGKFLEEATRILVPRGWLWIAEVRSRLEANDGSGDATKAFVACLKKMGYTLVKSDHSNKMFVVFQFQRQGAKNAEQPMSIKWPELKPCIYKRR